MHRQETEATLTMKMKLLFLPRAHTDPNDQSQMDYVNCPPLGISTLTAYLRKHNIDVQQDDLDIKTATYNDRHKKPIDLSLFNELSRIQKFLSSGQEEGLELEAEKILQLTPIKGYDIIGLSVVSPDNPSTASVPLVLGKLIKERTGATVVLGGPINSTAEKKVLASGHLDFGIIGSCETAIGETNLLTFCREFEKGSDMRTVPGVKFYREGKVRWNWRDYSKEEKFSITFPTFEGLPMDLYHRKIDVSLGGETFSSDELVLAFYFVRGCPNSCAFCSHSKEQQWDAAEPGKIADELHRLSRRYKTNSFFFHNPSVNPTYQFADALADALIERDTGIYWTDCASISSMDRALLTKLRRAGAIRLVFGFESASHRILELIGKPYRVPQAIEVMKAAHDAGIWTELDLICGFPYERDADALETIRFLKNYKGYILSCNLNKFWLEGRFLLQPERFGITYRDDAEALHKDWSMANYHERDGLGWEERIALTERTYERIQEAINRLFVRGLDQHELFACHKHADDWKAFQAAVKKYYNERG